MSTGRSELNEVNHVWFPVCRQAGIRSLKINVSVYAEDINGTSAECLTVYGDSAMVSCPVEKRTPRLGGGFVYAHMAELPAEKCRVRVKTEYDSVREKEACHKS